MYMLKTGETVNYEGPKDPEPRIFPLGGLLTWGVGFLSSLNEIICALFVVVPKSAHV